MAIKDLNNKKTGDKLYASEWNDVMNEILTHFKNKRIHQDMIITSNDELVYTDENNVRHQYVLHTKTGITYEKLTILSVNNAELNNNTYTYSNIPNSGNDISFQISYQREVLENGEHKEWQNSGARIVIDGNLPEGIELLIPDTNNSIKINVPENQDVNTKEYEFEVKVSMVETSSEEDQDNTKVFTIHLNQEAKTTEYGIPELNITLNTDLTDAIDTENKLKSSGGNLVFDVICTQQYGNDTLYITEGITATVQDNNGNILVTSYLKDDNSGIITIEIPRNDSISDVSYTIFEINATANGKSATPWVPETSYIQNKVIIKYSNPNTIILSYDDYPQAGSSTGILPSYSFKVDKNYDNGRSQEQNVSFNQLSTIPTGIQLTFNKISGSASVTSSTGKVVTTSSNSNYQSIELAKITLTVVAGEDSETSQEATVMQSGLTMPDLIYGQIPITNSDELDIENSTKQLNEFVTNQLINEFNNRFTTLPTSQFTSTFPTIPNKDYTIYCYLIKNYGNKQIKYVPPVGQKQPITFIGMNAGQYSQEISNYLYNDTYKLILILGEVNEDDRTINTIIE